MWFCNLHCSYFSYARIVVFLASVRASTTYRYAVLNTAVMPASNAAAAAAAAECAAQVYYVYSSGLIA